ncbi:MAG: hypothetical protein KH301_09490 [Brachyspira sp.]|nr:hypothetical protein [Brachyspira sp.]
MKVNRVCWPSSRGLINSCTEYVKKDRIVKILREPFDQGIVLKRIDCDKDGFVKKITTYINKNGNQTKSVEKR